MAKNRARRELIAHLVENGLHVGRERPDLELARYDDPATDELAREVLGMGAAAGGIRVARGRGLTER